MSFEGIAQIVGRAAEARRDIVGGARQGMVAAGLHTLGVSNTRVPHETGALMRTGAVSQDDATGLTAISYDDAEYDGQAVDQHENLEYQHDDGRSAKFLELSVASERETMLQIIATGAKEESGL